MLPNTELSTEQAAPLIRNLSASDREWFEDKVVGARPWRGPYAGLTEQRLTNMGLVVDGMVPNTVKEAWADVAMSEWDARVA